MIRVSLHLSRPVTVKTARRVKGEMKMAHRRAKGKENTLITDRVIQFFHPYES